MVFEEVTFVDSDIYLLLIVFRFFFFWFSSQNIDGPTFFFFDNSPCLLDIFHWTAFRDICSWYPFPYKLTCVIILCMMMIVIIQDYPVNSDLCDSHIPLTTNRKGLAWADLGIEPMVSYMHSVFQ